ncbi:TPA: site-specific integrase [Vibrio parahaemolyticus]|nr:site-specific integrase [Vibrio parahaemolyticus]HCH0725462.1 site-specific integrase [Vibrio parahaemolyticus]HCH1053908.1 site-specific integrase [Vibrio parahaemolyticus]
MNKVIPFNAVTFDAFLAQNEEHINVEFRCEKNPKFRAIVRKGYIRLGVRTSLSGKRHCKMLAQYPQTSPAKFLKQAEQYIGLLSQEPSLIESITLGQAFELYWKPYAEKNLKDIKTPLSRWSNHIATSALGRSKISKIKPVDIEQLLSDIADKGLAPATINKVHMLLSKVFNLAIKHGLCSRNPCKSIAQRAENNVVKTVFNEQQAALFIELAMKDTSCHPRALLLSLYTGMRISEVTNLKLKNVVSSQFLDLKMTKNGKPFRVYLNQPAQQLVEELVRSTHNEYLFPSSRNRNQPIAYPRAAFERILAKMKEKGAELDPNGVYTIHALRRSFSVFLYQKTESLYLVSQALNHSSTIVTQRYTSIFGNDMYDRVNQLNDFFINEEKENA